MKFNIDIKGLDAATDALVGRFSERRLNAVAATALTRTAREIEANWKRKLESSFDRPTAATTKATVVKRATAADPVAEVFIRDQARGTPPIEWLGVEESGGDRRIKRFEQALQSSGAMPRGMRAVPGVAAKLDGFGNVSKGQIIQVIAQLGAQYSPGYQRVISRSDVKRAQKALLSGRAYVAIQRRQGRLKPGIYERGKGGILSPVFFFVGTATYRRATNLIEEGTRVANEQLAAQVARALGKSAERLAQR